MRSVSVFAPSRLHFGLYAFGKSHLRQFGGVGAMVDTPNLEVLLTSASAFACSGEYQQRTRAFAQTWNTFHGCAGLPACKIEVIHAPREHTGLGIGTQLGLSVAAGLQALHGQQLGTPMELAASVGRGKRSAVGTYGFMLGGLIAERGKLVSEPISPLDMHVSLPAAWRFLLITPHMDVGLAGAAEAHAFETLPSVPTAVTEQLIRLAREQLIPAAVLQDFATFSSTLYEYCRMAGDCFATVQGGPYNGPILTRFVETLRRNGIVGVGQSSWGPTLFAVVENQLAGEGIAAELQREIVDVPFDCHVAEPSSRGAVIEVTENT